MQILTTHLKTLYYAPALLPRVAEVLGVSTDYLLSGNEGVITDIIPAIKADKTLTLKVKRALIALVEEYRSSAMSEESELENTLSILRNQKVSKVQALLDAFTTPIVERAKKVILCIASEGRSVFVSLPDDMGRTGTAAIPFLIELIKYNTEKPRLYLESRRL